MKYMKDLEIKKQRLNFYTFESRSEASKSHITTKFEFDLKVINVDDTV